MKSIYVSVFRLVYTLPAAKGRGKAAPQELLILAESQEDAMESVEAMHGLKCIFQSAEEGPALVYPVTDKAFARITAGEPEPVEPQQTKSAKTSKHKKESK